MKPSLSVIIGVYNGEAFLRESLDSVLNQSVPVDEIVVVDDGSTDQTPEILSSYGGALRVIPFETNQGLGAARERASLEATGDLLAFQDADDIWLPHKNDVTMEAFSTIPDLDFFFADMLNFDNETGRDVETSFLAMKDFPGDRAFSTISPRINLLDTDQLLADIMLNCYVNIQTAVFRREALLACGGFDKTFRRAQDADAFYKYAATQPKTAFSREVLVRRRIHGGNLIHDTFTGDFFQAKGMARHWDYIKRQPEPLKNDLIHQWRTVQRQAATGALRKGNTKQARELLRESIRRQGTLFDRSLLLSTYFPRSLRQFAGKMAQAVTGKHLTKHRVVDRRA
ncbi:MAG: glycosyltransferase [Lentisphaeria bacterium]|nr:glycosyltransferase [Lentisphaeria bacterium]